MGKEGRGDERQLKRCKYLCAIGHALASPLNLKETELRGKGLPILSLGRGIESSLGPQLWTLSDATKRQTDTDTHSNTHAHTNAASLLWSLHPVGQVMTQCFNRFCRGLMPREEFPHFRQERDGVRVIVTERRERKCRIREKRERESGIWIKGAAIEPWRLFHSELIIVLGSEKRRPYYSPVHNWNS